MRKFLLVILLIGLGVAVLLQLMGGMDFSLPEVTAAPTRRAAASPEPSRSPLPSDEPVLDIDATDQALNTLRFIGTSTAQAKQTEAMAVETQKAWQIIKWTADVSDLHNTATADAQSIADQATATVVARYQLQEQRLDDIRPYWDWGLLIVAAVMLYVFVLAMRYLLPALAARLAPHPDYVTIPVERDADDEPAEAPEFKLTINDTRGGGYRSRNFTMPCSPEVWVEFCEGLAYSKYTDFAEETWVTMDKNDPKLFTRRKFVQVRDVLLKQELIIPVKSSDPRGTFTSTSEGKIVFERGASARFDGIEFEPPPLPQI